MGRETSDFKLTFATEEFVWDEAPRPGMPLLRWPDGTLCEPVLFFFAYSAVNQRVRKISSLRPEAYALREWLAFLANSGLSLFDANDSLLERWRTNQGWFVAHSGARETLKRVAAKKNRRIERKLHNVFEFYRLLPCAMPFGEDGLPTPTLVGTINDTTAPITSKAGWHKRRRREYPVWSRAKPVRIIPQLPRSATESDAATLINFLRGRAFRRQKELRVASPPVEAQILADRDWLMAKCMIEGGLRCEEVSDLTVRQVAAALSNSGVTADTVDLIGVAHDKTERTRILKRILSLQRGSEYCFINVEITGKGDRARQAPFSLPLICALLEYVWERRTQQIAIWRKLDPAFQSPDQILLSHKSRGKLRAKAIGDLIASAFRSCGLKRSAHKLRGLFATTTAAALWREYFANNQFRFDQALVNNVLDRLARAMGHSSVSTTILFYVDHELFKHLTKIGTPEADLFRKLWDVLIMQKREISARRANLIVELAANIARSEDQSQLIQVLEIMLKDPRLVPQPAAHRAKPELAFEVDRAP